MCGIAGMVSTDIARSEAAVRAMLGRLVHRGPDDEGVMTTAGATLGVRRLSVIDIAGGHQPMTNEAGDVVTVQNGEIYNFLSIRSELQQAGHQLRTRSDTEIIPHGYEDFGDAIFERFRGMFAVAVWDAGRRRLVLARDRLGKKPLFYARLGDGFVFASELQALLAIDEVNREVDDEAIRDYLTYGYIPGPRSGFREIRKLLPAEILTLEQGEIAKRQYWNPQYEPKLKLPWAEAQERLRSEIEDAVRVRLVSDVPVGLLLSGGLDSSTVLAFMSRNSERRVKTFSVGFTDREYDELQFARLAARHFDSDHHEFVVEPTASEILPELVRHFGEPFADSSAIPTYYVARLARQHVTVVLNGDGGDESFGGYDRYRAVAATGMLDRVAPLRLLGERLARSIPARATSRRTWARIQRLADGLRLTPDARYFSWMTYFPTDAFHQPPLTNWTDFFRLANRARATDSTDRAMASDLLAYLPGDLLVKMDITTMASSLEARAPLLDHQLVEYLCQLPRHYKVSPWNSKLILRSAMRGILPPELLRRGKMGFEAPVASWLRGPLRPMVEDLVLRSTSHVRSYLRGEIIDDVANDHLSGRHDRTRLLWCLLMLELWFEIVVRQTPAAREQVVQAH